jgi:hypothetical protein
LNDTGKRDSTQDDLDKSLEIGLSDVLCALDYLAPKSARANKAIAEILGFKWHASDLESEDESGFKQAPKMISKKIEGTPALDLESLWLGNRSATSKQLEPVMQGDPPRLEEGDAFSVDWEDVEELAETNVQLHNGAPPFMPLFNERWVRGIMSVLISVPELLTKLDFKLLEKLSASASLIETLPYLSRMTLNHGVQLLLDVSESMQPFWKDEAELVSALRHLLDPLSVSVYRFEFELWPEPQINWWVGSPELLREKIPVLLVSNFGVARQGVPLKMSDNESLLMLIRQAKSKKCPMAALVPTVQAEWPGDLKSLIPMSFVWDRTTSPQTVYRQKRP